MKVLFIAPYYIPLTVGGFQSQVYNIFNALHTLGIDTDWYSLDKKQTRIENYDILQVMDPNYTMLGTILYAKSKGVKVVMTPMQGSNSHSNQYIKKCLALSHIPQVCSIYSQRRKVMLPADYMTPLSSAEIYRLREIYGLKCPMSVIPNGIDDIFLNDNTYEEFPLPFEEYILVIGRIEDNKNQMSLIKAVNMVGKNLIIVGEPSHIESGYIEQCKAISGSNIYYWGLERDRSKLKTLYRKASLTVIPSKSEMVPLVIFESLSQNTPVVCTRHCNISGDVIPGLLFSDITPSALCDSIKQQVCFNHNDITRQGVYSWKDIAQMYLDVYEKVLK